MKKKKKNRKNAKFSRKVKTKDETSRNLYKEGNIFGKTIIKVNPLVQKTFFFPLVFQSSVALNTLNWHQFNVEYVYFSKSQN